MFTNRKSAGRALAEKLTKYKNAKNTLVIGLPRGGVPVAAEVAKALKLPLDITCPRKIGAPHNPEYAIGAITETGEGIFNERVIRELNIPQTYLTKAIEEEKMRAKHYIDLYRSGTPPQNLNDKTIILVDDGLATGFTMKAAIQSVKAARAKKIIVAIPVSPIETLEDMKTLVNDTISLETPFLFYAVGQFYMDFTPTTDEEVIACLTQLRHG